MGTRSKTASRWPRRALRALLGLALGAAGVLVMLNHTLLRTWETITASVLADAVTPGEMYLAPGGQSFFWAAATPDMRGLNVTVECTSAFLLGPLLILAGLILMSGRFGVTRSLTATAIAAALLFLANQGRLVLIAWATARWGVGDGYQWSHTVGGSLVVGAGVALALAGFMLVLAARRKKRGKRRGTFRPTPPTARTS